MVSEVLIVANRLPISRVLGADGGETTVASPGGLVSALGPVASRLHCTWLGVLEAGEASETFEKDGLRMVTVGIEAARYRGYYEGFANQVLWPVFHGLAEYVSTPPESVGDGVHTWHEEYRSVNRQFAERIAETAAPGALVWVHDYHLLLVPGMVRALRPDIRIAVFLHIPFPSPTVLEQYSWGEEILAGVSEADFIGVQRDVDADRLRRALANFSARTQLPTRVRIQAIPISIDVAPFEAAARVALALGAPAAARERLGVSARQMILSVDRLDYTKGIVERLNAFESLLETWPQNVARPVLVQVLTPTRESVPAYQTYGHRVRSLVDRICRRFGGDGYSPVITLNESQDPKDLVTLYLACDVMCVTPLRDGMNLVAKEFVASRVDERGVLVLGREAGAADRLTGALLVDPEDTGALRDSLREALMLDAPEVKERVREMRESVRSHDVHAWAARFLSAALAGEPATDLVRVS